MKKLHNILASCLFLSIGWVETAAASPVVVQDFAGIDAKSSGTFQDNLGSKITLEIKGKAPEAELVLHYSLQFGGWCGIWCRAGGADWAGVDLSQCKALHLSVNSPKPVQLALYLKDKNNNQYTATAPATKGGGWETVTVPLNSFTLDPYYTPPDAIKGAPRDFSRVSNFSLQPKTPGTSSVTLKNFIADNEVPKEARLQNPVVTMSRSGGNPISPFAFGSNYFNWVDWGKDGRVALNGTEELVKALRLNFLVGDNNQNDANTPQLFNESEEDKYIQYCRAVGAEPLMLAPVYGNNVDGGKTSAKGAADIVAYINGTKKYGVKYWTVGDEVDIYDQFFHRTTDLPVSTVSQYIQIYKSYAKAMKEANAKTGSGVEMKFVGPELGWRYLPGNDWLSPMLDECKDYIDVASIHAYGFSAKELTEEGVLNDIDKFRPFVEDVKARVALHGKPGTPLAITEANVCYDWDSRMFTPEQRRVGPGTFYAALWDADRMGAALEEGLWNFSFWDLAEPAPPTNNVVFGVIWTDFSKNPPTYQLNPEYYAQQMVNTNFSGESIIPSGVPEHMSVYASYDAKKAATVILVLNKDKVKRTLTLAVDNLKPLKTAFAPMSINLVTIPDDTSAGYHWVEYTQKMADAGLPPKELH